MEPIVYQAPIYPLEQKDCQQFIERALNNFFSIENQSILFNFDNSTIKFELKILDFFSNIKIKSNQMDEFYDSLRGKKTYYNISFSFKNTTFDEYPSFDNLHCNSLNFYNTIFQKGAKIRWVTANEINYSPRTLDADVTFTHDGYTDIDNGKLSVLTTSSIKKFKFRHNLEGNGWTYFIGFNITEKADFTNTVLNKVHFSNMDMTNCYFANAIIQDTRFINCEFPKTKDLWTAAMSKTGNITSNPKLYGLLSTTGFFLAISGFFLLFGYLLSVWESIFLFVLLIIPFFIYPFLFLNRFMFGWHNRLCMHFSTADEKLAFKEKDPKLFTKNIGILREVYRQLRTNLEKNNDFQKAGEFYFSQRHIESAMFDFEDPTKSAMQQLLMYSLHWINGFGERWVRSLIWFFLTIISFSFVFTPNDDYIITPDTPGFLLVNNESRTINDYKSILSFSLPNDFNQTKFTNNENILYHIKLPTDLSHKIFIQKKVMKLNDNLTVRFTYSLSHLVAPFTPDEKKWFTTNSEKAYILGFLETLLLWLFAFAAGVAINNRIKR